jgi:hypothetical protein
MIRPVEPGSTSGGKLKLLVAGADAASKACRRRL